jgi:hypothetical protein
MDHVWYIYSVVLIPLEILISLSPTTSSKSPHNQHNSHTAVMQPSKTLQHQGWGTWWPPHTEHAYFSWSAGQPGSVPPDSKLAQEALKAGEHIHSSGGGVGGPPRGTSNVHYNYYGGRRPFRYGGFGGGGFGRRIFYVSLGGLHVGRR